MRFYDALANAFAAEGTTDVFGMTGEANIYWLTSMEERGVRMYQVRHEGAGLAMADGWARVTGNPGVCTTTGGPGAAQLATTMIVASRARTPLVALTGDTPRGDLDNAQYLERPRYAASIEAGFVQIHTPDEAYGAVQRAFYLARRESRPIMLNVPAEFTHTQFDEFDDYVPSTALLGKTRPAYPHPDAIEEAAEIIARSERPVIIVGRGAIAAQAGDAIRKLADRTGAVIATTLMAKNWLGDYPYHAGLTGLFATKNAIQLFQRADCVIAFGASLNRYTTEHGYLYPNATYIQVDSQPHVVMGNGQAADCYVHADAGLALAALDQALAGHAPSANSYHAQETLDLLGSALADPRTFDIGPGTVDTRDAARTLDETIPGNIGMVLGGGQQNHFGIMLCNRQRDYLVPNLHFASIGQGLTTAMGAVIARRNQPAFLMEGDAGFMMHLAEFETAVRYNIPLLVCVFNDQGFAAEYHHYRKNLGGHIDVVQIPTPDLGKVAVALGGRGALATSTDELRRAAADFVANPGPMIIDVRVSREVASIPNRRRYLGEEDQ